jgi:uncharacterized protein (DUF302 family)
MDLANPVPASIAALCASIALCAAGLAGASPAHAAQPVDRFAATDAVFEQVNAGITRAGYREELQIDHARLAEAAGKTMPAARVVLFSDPAISAALLRANVRAGLDLPFRVLAYQDGTVPAVAYTDSSFLAKRHGLQDAPALAAYDAALGGVLSGIGATASAVPTTSLSRDQGVIELVSAYGYEETVERLKTVVSAQGDTVWFGEIDFQQVAASQDVKIRPARLLLFGGPAPGAVAMAAFPAIGLDAFCQKLYVYEDEEGAVRVLFNSIVALAELHYGRSAEPHRMLDQRLTGTFKKAIERATD